MEHIRAKLTDYLSLKKEDTRQNALLLQDIEAEEISPSDLESLVRMGPVLQQSQLSPGKLHIDLRLKCRQLAYQTTYSVYLPPQYDPHKSWPLLIVGHGGNGNMSMKQARMAAYSGLEDWLPIAEKRGWIVAAPLTERGWGVIGYGVLFSMLFVLKRQCRIDPDRIWLTGHSMGGHLSWRSALHLGDRWAAVSPMSGGYDYVAKGMMPLLNLVPGYATFGHREPYGIAEANRSMQDWLAQHPEIDWQIVEKAGGHEIFKDELPKIADFFEARSRNLYRSELLALGLPKDRWDTPNPPWDQRYYWDSAQPIYRSYFHWLQLFDNPRLPKGAFQEVSGKIVEENNSIYLQLKNCERLRVYLHPNMLDLKRNIHIYLNGELYWDGVPTPRPGLMLENIRLLDDWGRLFPTAVDIDLRRMI